jgi:hypothetical protein
MEAEDTSMLNRRRTLMVTHLVKRDITLAYLISGIVALIMCVVSVVGILFGNDIYPVSQVSSNIGTDALNLVVALPTLLTSMWFARRGSLIGLLIWPGALFYILYVYTFYILGVPFSLLFLPYIALVTLSGYTIISLVASIDGESVRQRLGGNVPERITGGMFILISILFLVVDIVLIINALISHTLVSSTTYASWVTDFTVQLPALFVVGILLWRRETLGYVAAPGLLFQGGVLNAGFALVLVIEALFTASPINVPFVALVFVTGAMSFTLLAFFVRGAVRVHLPATLGTTAS